VPKVTAYFAANGVQLGVRVSKGSEKGVLRWRPAGRRTWYEILRHPSYAGAYVYGRCPAAPAAKASGGRKSGRRSAPPEEWVCLLRDRVPAYLSWEQYEQKRRRLSENDRGRGATRSASGRAPTLLNGRLTCGRCGAPMAARNARPGAAPRYACDRARLEGGGPMCQGMAASAVDRLVEGLISRAVQPAALELSLRAAEQAEQDRERLHAHGRQKQERAEYEAGLARRRYEAVDPDNRLVARELERQWEQLTELRGLGKTGEQIAEELNRESHRTARGGPYTGARVRSLCVQLGLTAVPAGVASPADWPGQDEWWLPRLAGELKVKPIVVHRWRWSGWVHARQLAGANGRWVVWADAGERQRLLRLRKHETENRGQEAPEELRTPAARPR
jgi:hypothetical protein